MPQVVKGKGECIVVKGMDADGVWGGTVGTYHTSLPTLWHSSGELFSNILYVKALRPSFLPQYASHTPPHACLPKFQGDTS